MIDDEKSGDISHNPIYGSMERYFRSGSGICFKHIEHGKCKCKKVYFSRVKAIKSVYEDGFVEQRPEVKAVASYVLNPCVKEMIKMYGEYIKVVNRNKN